MSEFTKTRRNIVSFIQPVLASVIERIAAAQNVAVLTGAGISAESGVATFRGENGIWNKFKPEELASMDAFMKNPELVWEWYEYRRKILEAVSPNQSHHVLAEMETFFPHFSISTQNVDGLHFQAGSENVYELHGNISRNRCAKCDRIVRQIEIIKGNLTPRCQCGGLIRPDVVWFGEMLPQDVLDASFEEAAIADVYFSIGTSAVVYPAAMLPNEAKRHGAFVIEINLEPTSLTPYADISIRGKSGTVLPEIWQQVKNLQ